MTPARALAAAVRNNPDAREVVFGFRPIDPPLTPIEINSTLAEMFHADRVGTLRRVDTWRQADERARH